MNTSGVMCPLIDFNMLVDTDFGIIRYIQNHREEYSNFDFDILDKYKLVDELSYLLYYRENWNPLSIISVGLTSADIDKIYWSIILNNNKYKEVLQLSRLTDFYKTLNKFRIAGDIDVSIYCTSNLEIDILNTLNNTKKLNKLIITDKKEIKKYNQIYIKSFLSNPSITDNILGNIIGCTLYIASYKFNLIIEENSDLENYLRITEYFRNNTRVMDIYNKNNWKDIINDGN